MGFMAHTYIPQYLGGKAGDHYELEDSLGESKNLFQNTIFFKKLKLPYKELWSLRTSLSTSSIQAHISVPLPLSTHSTKLHHKNGKVKDKMAQSSTRATF